MNNGRIQSVPPRPQTLPQGRERLLRPSGAATPAGQGANEAGHCAVALARVDRPPRLHQPRLLRARRERRPRLRRRGGGLPRPPPRRRRREGRGRRRDPAHGLPHGPRGDGPAILRLPPPARRQGHPSFLPQRLSGHTRRRRRRRRCRLLRRAGGSHERGAEPDGQAMVAGGQPNIRGPEVHVHHVLEGAPDLQRGHHRILQRVSINIIFNSRIDKYN